MGCNCGKPAVEQQAEYEVRTAAGKVETFQSEPEARIFATMNNGRVTVKKK